MYKRACPYVLASTLHSISDDEARALVDQLLGASHEWPSDLIEYRLSAPFQADFKAEWGHWLHTMGLHGVCDEIVTKVLKRAKRETRAVGVDSNDRLNLVLAQEMAPAMFAHYFCGTGWTFGGLEWEHNGGSAGDVDLRLSAPDGTPVMFQVKSPDQPGHVVNHRLVGGEFDDRVVAAVEKAAGQLPKTGPEAKIIAVSPNRTWPMSSTPYSLVTKLIGSTLQLGGGAVVLPKANLGRFAAPEWRHVSGVVIVDYVRAAPPVYGCTVLLNPWSTVRAPESWFRAGRVAVLNDDTFRWAGGEPEDSTLPDGTPVVDGY